MCAQTLINYSRRWGWDRVANRLPVTQTAKHVLALTDTQSSAPRRPLPHSVKSETPPQLSSQARRTPLNGTPSFDKCTNGFCFIGLCRDGSMMNFTSTSTDAPSRFSSDHAGLRCVCRGPPLRRYARSSAKRLLLSGSGAKERHLANRNAEWSSARVRVRTKTLCRFRARPRMPKHFERSGCHLGRGVAAGALAWPTHRSSARDMPSGAREDVEDIHPRANADRR
jgi:hypothetical protein